ncbi:MAG: DUF983 domain-containing protein [Hyphomicrobium sp.]|jgi:uncharacterized protein (DUF983 family)|nr:DUF983 domain-containing protein [Hyphomicrobium sp.]
MTVIKTTSDSTAQIATEREVLTSLKRGWKQRCPSCATGALYSSYLKVNDACPSCGQELHHQRADDAPPYFTMTIVGHIVVFGILFAEQNFSPPIWMQLAFWLPLTVLLSLWILPRVKGALIGYQWANRMHGFGSGAFEGADLVPTEPKPATTP